MNMQRLLPAAGVAIAGLTLLSPSVQAQEPQSETAPASSEQPSQRQVLEACVQNRAETLPNPFVDVPANHWAYKAVLTMHYCGAYRQATPPSLIERLLQQSTSPNHSPGNNSEANSNTSQTSS